MKQLAAKYWYVLVILALVITIVLIFVFKKKKGVTIEAPKPVEVIEPTTGQTVPFNPGPFTDALWQEMDRNSWWSGRNLRPYQDLMALTDGQFKAVANDWNQRYFSRAGNRTLAARIAAEKGWSISNDEDNQSFPSLRDTIVQRYKRLLS